MALICSCGTAQPLKGTLWASTQDGTQMAPLCAGCGRQLVTATTALPDKRLALHTVINYAKLSEASNAAILNVKASLLAQFNWRDDPAYRAWLAQPPRQFLYKATQQQFDALVASLAPDRRILIYDYVNLETSPEGRAVPPLVMVWVLPCTKEESPGYLSNMETFQ